ncbi:MAG: 1-acyl-sn-glycerol-3-phosphate acyltransferase [Alistipes sp.]|nr:1-acyl-sn-glycerol-3-phosphate acyltransferase [Alistipes sp.]MBQ6585088.1 1-acyl-sn-glycerol-3-phosphate acyltransferase [Alistipes sp.]
MFSIIFYIFTLIQLTFFFILSVLALVVCFPFDKPRRVVHSLSRAICMCFWYGVPTWRRKIEGLENIDKKKSYVIVINHNSMVDILALYFLPLNFRWVSKREVFRIPYVGQLLTIHGDIAIDRSKGADSMRKVSEDGKMWIGRGASIAMFPEGTRSKSGEMGRFKQGAFALAKEAGVEILPVVMHGTRTVLNKFYLVNWRNVLKVSVLPPISAEEVAATPMPELMEKTRTMMCEKYNQLRK